MNEVGYGREAQFILMNVNELLKATDGSLLVGEDTAVFSFVFIDSRSVLPFSLFVALKGERQNGHAFIEDALKRGASIILVDRFHAEKDFDEYKHLSFTYHAAFISVENTLRALQLTSKFYLNKMNLRLKVGITGSSGKTTVKELIGAVFSQISNTFVSEGNLNSETGLPLSIFNLRPDHEVGVFEIGMNRRGEIAELSSVLCPDVAIITNIGLAHVGMLGSRENIAKEKKDIFLHFSDRCVGFVPKCDYTQFLQDVPKGKFVTFSRDYLNGLEGVEFAGMLGSVIRYKGMDIHLPLLGEHNIDNSICAITVADYFDIPLEKIKFAIENVKASFGRAELRKGFTTCFFDCYNANPSSMKEAIRFCDSLSLVQRRVYILGSMLELGAESLKEHENLCRLLFNSNADIIFLFGEEMLSGFESFLENRGVSFEYVSSYERYVNNKKVFFFNDREFERLERYVKDNISGGDFVLLKASRSLLLERLECLLI